MLRSPARAFRWRLSCATLAAVATVSCSDSPTGPRSLPVTITGPIVNRSGEPIPENARVVAVWAGDDGNGDYLYVFGEGTVDRAANRFSITFDRNPPEAALLGNELGVALVVMTTDANLHEGRLPDSSEPPPSIIGATGNHAIIFLNASPPSDADWVRHFRRGYNLGRGVDQPGTFDGFEPVDLGSMELIVDDLANIEFVNWT